MSDIGGLIEILLRLMVVERLIGYAILLIFIGFLIAVVVSMRVDEWKRKRTTKEWMKRHGRRP